jgi:uncharacterized repeat protein (TIGR01451 family)
MEVLNDDKPSYLLPKISLTYPMNKLAGKLAARPGDTVSCNVLLRNTGLETARDVSLKISLPKGINYAEGSGSSAPVDKALPSMDSKAYPVDKTPVTWNLSEFKHGEERSVNFQLKVEPDIAIPKEPVKITEDIVWKDASGKETVLKSNKIDLTILK